MSLPIRLRNVDSKGCASICVSAILEQGILFPTGVGWGDRSEAHDDEAVSEVMMVIVFKTLSAYV